MVRKLMPVGVLRKPRSTRSMWLHSRRLQQTSQTMSCPGWRWATCISEPRRFEQAILWYEAALELSPDHVDVWTNLGISYYYAGQTERAVVQFEQSLEIDPSNQRTLLSLGIVRAFGLQDIEGATALWERVIEIAPDSPEGRAARHSLDQRTGRSTDGGGLDLP